MEENKSHCCLGCLSQEGWYRQEETLHKHPHGCSPCLLHLKGEAILTPGMPEKAECILDMPGH